MSYLNDWDDCIPHLDVVDDYQTERKEIQRIQPPGFPFSFGDVCRRMITWLSLFWIQFSMWWKSCWVVSIHGLVDSITSRSELIILVTEVPGDSLQIEIQHVSRMIVREKRFWQYFSCSLGRSNQRWWNRRLPLWCMKATGTDSNRNGEWICVE